MDYSSMNSPSVHLINLVCTQTKAKIQHPSRGEQRRECFTRQLARRHYMFFSFAFYSDWEWQRLAVICIRITRPALTKCLSHEFSPHRFIPAWNSPIIASKWFFEKLVMCKWLIVFWSASLNLLWSGTVSQALQRTPNAGCSSKMWRFSLWKLKWKLWLRR